MGGIERLKDGGIDAEATKGTHLALHSQFLGSGCQSFLRPFSVLQFRYPFILIPYL